MSSSLSPQFGKYSPDGSVQLPLLATPKEILGHHSPHTEAQGYPSVTSEDYANGLYGGVEAVKGRVQELFDRKERESSPAFRESVAKHGVQVPIHLTTWAESTPEGERTGKVGQIEVGNGNHRLAVSAKHAPDALIPISYSHNYEDARRGERAGLPRHTEGKY